MSPRSRFGEALAYANRIHAGQVCKGADFPYVSHLLGVAALAIEMGADEIRRLPRCSTTRWRIRAG